MPIDLVRFHTFIDEFQMQTVRYMNDPLSSNQLPELRDTSGYDVHIPKSYLTRFRNDYRLLWEFAAAVCGKKIEDITYADLFDYAAKKYTEENPLNLFETPAQ